MKEHPIPQDVTGYKFHIVGNMTLKQFAEVGAGVLVAVILYNTNLLAFIKWPLIMLSVGLGGMMAFVPIEERPLDHWIVTFFRRLYSPTKFYWRKDSTIPFALKPEKTGEKPAEPQFEIDLTPARQQRIRDYLASVSQPTPLSETDQAESAQVSKILQTFDEVPVEVVRSKQMKIKPQLTPRIRKLSVSQHQPAEKQTVFQTELTTTEKTPAAKNLPLTKPPTTELPAKPELEPVATTPIEVFADETPPIENTYTAPQQSAATNAKLPFPQKNLSPNTIMGMVLTPDDKLVDRAVVTIKNLQGKVIRALKTNLLGQFFATTPLPNGTYVVSAEKEGLSFPEQTFSLNGSVLQPLELRAA
ncbi:MAG: hypothetical protein UY47_C0003G0027 [Parcubacteria group bacterium GW2011_GWB1_49_7]|nr:MAG: hypothetical protein UX28_C0004G0034 [Candidatus Pacebacteria bacterium GW2011_GWA1_46_10]KKW09939.1 MAG: hypothetical protein UY47_C0003G0027 [Parcubacteria group bacterium GW2011_GWB1_49_7]HCR80929.1 hypothetical protein [Candidatus Paceibacterota bacterium]